MQTTDIRYAPTVPDPGARGEAPARLLPRSATRTRPARVGLPDPRARRELRRADHRAVDHDDDIAGRYRGADDDAAARDDRRAGADHHHARTRLALLKPGTAGPGFYADPMTAKVAVIGAGYVGLTSAACFAHLGHDVVCADVDEARVRRLEKGDVPILEAGLSELVAEGLDANRLRFVVGAANAARDAEFVFLCVPTPFGDGGGADLSVVEDVVARDRAGAAARHRHREQVDDAGRLHAARRPRAGSERRRQRHRRRVEPRVPPRGARGARLPPHQSHRDRVRRHRHRRPRVRALQGSSKRRCSSPTPRRRR